MILCSFGDHVEEDEEATDDPIVAVLVDRVEFAGERVVTHLSVHEQRVACIEDFAVREKLDIGASEVRSPAAIAAIVDAIAALESSATSGSSRRCCSRELRLAGRPVGRVRCDE